MPLMSNIVESETELVRIASQYTTIAGSFRQMFDALSPRTGILNNEWRSQGSFKNVGSCKSMSRTVAISSYEGAARDYLIFLADQKNQQTSGVNTLTDCAYHREKGGCVLQDLMNPFCLEHITYPRELEDRFNIYGYRLMAWIRQTLKQVMAGEADEDFISQKVYQINYLTSYIETFPMLTEEEQVRGTLGFFK